MEAPSKTLAAVVVRDHYALLLRFLHRRARSKDDVDDLCQEVLTRLSGIPADSVRNIKAYLYQCMRAVLADHYGEQTLPKFVPIDENDGEQVPHLQEDSIAAVEFGEDLLRVLKMLPTTVAKDVYIKRVLQGTPFTTIAAELNITVKSARTYFSNISSQVWEILWAQGGPEK